MTNDTKTELLQVRMTRDEKKMLNELADAEGMSASQLVRHLVRRAHRDATPIARPRKRATKK